ncbi:MAG TPA: biotin/lipoyl-binding protein, partial [Anaerolineales bacterium]|nr:biotin/lipoyl-binding protein [Anaerolineales bacterium]
MKSINLHRAEQSSMFALRRRSALFILNIIVIALALSSCTARASTSTAIPTVSLDNNNSSSSSTQSSDANAVSASAVVAPVNDAQLSFSAVGRVISVDVKAGDKVTAGQTLVKLDTTLLEAKVKEAEADVLAADAQIRYLNRLATDP